MKKLLFSVLIMSVLFTAQAGFIIRGIDLIWDPDANFRNYTLTFDGSGNPISVGSVHTTFGTDMGRNSILFVNANTNAATVFLISNLFGDSNIEVRDCHFFSNENRYVLCGSRQIGLNPSHAFVAVVDGGLSSMQFVEYPDVSIFYSVLPEMVFSTPMFYLFCGTKNNHGFIVAIDPIFFQMGMSHETSDPWEFHKIIAKRYGNGSISRLIASGRNPERTLIGFIVINLTGSARPLCYNWYQSTNLASLCVVSDYVLENDKIILASSSRNQLILNPVTLSSSIQVSEFTIQISSPSVICCVQDIGTIHDNGTTHISVAGYLDDGQMHHAWHGSVNGLSGASMNNNNYFGSGNDRYEHYKIRYNPYQLGKEYTGGYFQSDDEMGALFGTPMINAPLCDYRYDSPVPTPTDVVPFFFNLGATSSLGWTIDNSIGTPYTMTYDYNCGPFKSAPAPEYAMPSPEDESDIIVFQDRITLKDVPSNTNYQIYSVIGQLIQAGTTTPDISTAQLGKGVYILRLEDGKTFKFVR